MRIWIDLANSPHVPFFSSLANQFKLRGHEVVATARNFTETVELATRAGFEPVVIGGHGGGKLSGKAGNLVQRALSLARWARGRDFDIAVSHNSYSQILAARALSLKTITLMDYEHQPANHLAFRFASRIIVPRAFPESALKRFGADPSNVRRYDGIKEDVYLADFQPDPQFQQELTTLGIAARDVVVTVRPPAGDALYHRFENELFEKLLDRLVTTDGVKVVLLPRNDSQRKTFAAMRGLIVPGHAPDGANLIASSDLVVSAGGTMNREAAALGVPAASIYAGEWAAIDDELVRQGRLQRISTQTDVDNLRLEKKTQVNPQRAVRVREQVVRLILDEYE
jgi:uncharacterized protein